MDIIKPGQWGKIKYPHIIDIDGKSIQVWGRKADIYSNTSQSFLSRESVVSYEGPRYENPVLFTTSEGTSRGSEQRIKCQIRDITVMDYQYLSCHKDAPTQGMFPPEGGISWNASEQVLSIDYSVAFKFPAENGGCSQIHLFENMIVLIAFKLDKSRKEVTQNKVFPEKILQQENYDGTTHTVIYEDGLIANCHVSFLETPSVLKKKYKLFASAQKRIYEAIGKTSTGKKRGRNKKRNKEKDTALRSDWNGAHESGCSKKDFCNERDITPKELDCALRNARR